ncbi:Flavodoxins [Hahella chejuensis KCTC 2396]|uniref:Flavodoxins n=1 Tax=Hahella chejuensis (strain KCTC 2396) TaxID=349521 RepID=Q2SNU4_HAHCH|nr:flavodoxin [Hahella chejuensis]ABC27680.1 Flavodoxins [Hahella chejuensis KCTC 2396]
MKKIVICVGTVYGAALETAEAVQKALNDKEYEARVAQNPTLEDITEADSAALICTSTTGSGDLPDNIAPLYTALTTQFPNIVGKPFGLITLGDSSYFDSYCGAGEQMEHAMTELAAVKVGEELKIDAMETTDPAEEAVAWALEWAQQLP